MQNLKTLWQLLQEVVEKEEKRFSLHDFLLESTEEDRKNIETKLTDADTKQFFEFMDWYTFVNRDEVYSAVCEYYEFTMDRSASMWECLDLRESADYYIDEKNLNFDEE